MSFNYFYSFTKKEQGKNFHTHTPKKKKNAHATMDQNVEDKQETFKEKTKSLDSIMIISFPSSSCEAA